jgi:hypothetical protein
MAGILFLGGIFNKMFLGIPYYLWIMVLMVILEIMIFVLWLFFQWFKLQPYHGLLWATIKKAGASFVFDENMHFDFITDRSSKVIFAETFEQAQDAERRKTEAPAATIGTVRSDFVFDPKKWTYPNSYQHKLVENIAEKHNMQNPDDQVRLLPTFMEYAIAGKFNGDVYADDMANLELYMTIPWSRIKMMYKDRNESGVFGFVMSLAATLEEIQNESMNKYSLLLLGVFLLIDVVIIAAHYIGG